MWQVFRGRLAVAVVFGLAVAPVFGDDLRRVPIPTTDGVELEGTYYPNPNGKKDACVLLLHNFDRSKGGDSHKDGWDHLASELQKNGYAVLSFDFRGFGNSKKVSPKFWMYPTNRGLRAADKSKEEIDHKYFPVQYYPALVNDVAAAKAFLDRRNDAKEVNSSNLVVIGAGEGATLGALWMASQCRLQRDRSAPGGLGVVLGPPVLDEPECRDLACGVWLTISPTLAGVRMPVKTALQDTVRMGKVRMAFVYGKKDAAALQIAKDMKESIIGTKADLKTMIAAEAIGDTNLTGSKLLNDTLDTENWIISKCLDTVLEKRTNLEWRKREVEKHRFFWAIPKPGPGANLVLDKLPTDELHQLIPLQHLGVNSGGQ